MAIAITNLTDIGAFKFEEVAANNGAIANGLTIKISDGIFAGNNGDALAATFTGTPSGLTPVLVKTSATTALLTFSGTATAHENANDVNSFGVTFKDTAFATGGAAPAAVTVPIDFVNKAAVGTLSLLAPQGADTKQTYKTDTLPTVTGTAPSGVDKVYIYNNGGTKPIASVDVTDGAWSFTLPATKLKDGAYFLTASTSSDGMGAMSGGFGFKVDQKAPAFPTVNTIKGAISSTTPLLSGKAEKGATVEVFAGETLLGTTIADAKGVWSLQVTNPAILGAEDKSYDITAKATDAAGNFAVSKKAVPLIIDTKIAAPTLVVGTIKKNVVPLTGSVEGETGGTLQLYGGADGSLALGKPIKIGKDGSWKAKVKLTDGPHKLSVIAIDAAGNVSASSIVSNVEIDTFTATPTLQAVMNGDVLTGLEGTAEAGATIKITIGAEKNVKEAQVQPDGTWQVSLEGFAPAKLGKLKITAIATDQATPTANVSKISNALEYTFAAPVPDTTAPTFVVAETSFDGKTIALTYNEDLGGTAPDKAAFTVASGETTNAVTAVAISGKTVILTLTTPIAADSSYTVSYAAPAAETTAVATDAAIQDAVGNNAAALTNQVVTLKLPTEAADTITGSSSDDSINGLGGDDSIDGAAGNDILIGGAGADTLTGGAGDDTFDLTDADAAIDVITDWGNGADVLTGTLALGGQLNVTIFDTSATAFSAAAIGGKVSVTGGAANDSITGSTGNDTLTGGAGNDTLTGAVGSDTFNVDKGTDTITDLSGTDVLVVSAGATANVTVSANFTATAGTSNHGTAHLTTAGKSVNLAAATGTNGFSVTNTGVATTITGSASNDTIVGGTGNDTIVGGAGADLLTGGAGVDTFTLTDQSIASGIDHITDFVAGTDKLKIGALIDNSSVTNLSFFSVGGANLAAATANAVAGALSIAQDNFNQIGDAVIFKFAEKTYIAINRANDVAFDDGTDILVEITGVTGAITSIDIIS